MHSFRLRHRILSHSIAALFPVASIPPLISGGNRSRGTSGSRRLALAFAGLAAAAVLAPSPASAANGVWTGATNNAWASAGNWTGGIPNAAGDIADFSQFDLNGNQPINLAGVSRTVGLLTVGDFDTATGAGANTFNFNANAGIQLILLGAGNTAETVDVVNRSATINTVTLRADNGFIKTGAGTLVLNNANSIIAKGIALNAGTLTFVSGSLGALAEDNLITTGGNAGLTWSGHTDDISNRIKLGDGFALTVSLAGDTTFATTLKTGALGTGSLTKGGASTLTITAAQTYTGGTRINAGRLILTNGDNQLSTAGTVSFGNAATSGILQLGDATGKSDQTVTGLIRTGNASSLSNAIVGGHTSNSVLTINNATAISGGNSPIFGGAGTNEDHLALVKSGAGALTLSKTNTFVGDVTLIGGNLIATNNSSLGAGTKTVTISGTTNAPSLQLSQASGLALASTISFVTSNDDATAGAIVNTDGNNVIGGNITLADGGFGGTQTRIRVAAGSLTLNGAITASSSASNRTLILDGASNGTANGIISNNGAITTSVIKEGAGTWTLTAANTYSGATTVAGGRLNLATAQTGTGALSAADGTTLGVAVAAPGQSLTPSTLTLGTTTDSTLSFDLGAFANPTAPVINTGAFTVNGTTRVPIAGTGLSTGTFTLIQYTGTIGGTGFASFPAGNLPANALPARVTANLVDDSANSRVLLNVSQFNIPKWTGDITGDWDVNDGVDPTTGSGTANWKELIGGAVTRYLQFGATVDSVLFDDSAEGTTTVNLTTSLSPTSVTIDNSEQNYTFTGSGKLTGATSLLKTGTQTLFLVNTGGNDYTGTTTINDGTIQVGDGATPSGGQLGSGAVAIGDEGTLSLNRPVGDDYSLANVISGSGDIFQNGANTVTLTGNNSAYDGEVTINSGVLRVGSGNALGTAVGGVIVEAAGALELQGQTVAESLLLNGGTLRAFSGTTNNIVNGIALNGGGSLDGLSATTLTVSSVVTGTGGLTKNGAGTAILVVDNSYIGGTIVTQGVLQLGANAATTGLVGPGDIAFNVAAGTGTLSIVRGGNFDLSNNITSSGAGTNAVTVGVGGAASLSGTVTFSGTNTFTGNVTINGGALRITNSSALGIGTKIVRIGDASRPALKIDGSLGGITLASGINFAISSDGSGANGGAIVNVAGDNVIEGTISQINGGGGNGRIFVEAGSLTIEGGIDADGATGARTLLLGGPALGIVNGIISDFNNSAASVVSVTKDGAGTWELNGFNEFTGALAVQNGTLKINFVDALGNAQPLGAASSAVTLGAATTSGILEYTGGTATLFRPITVLANSVGSTVRNSGSGVLTLGGSLVKNSTKLTLTGGDFIVGGVISGANANSDFVVDGSTVTLSNVNTYNGPTNVISGGTLKNGIDNAISAGSTVVLGEATGNTDGTYDLNGFNQAVAGLSGDGTGTHRVTNSALSGISTLTHTGTSTYAGVIQDGATAQVAVTKDIGGTFTLAGVNTYTGATTVNAGTLLIGGSISGSVATVTGATSTLGGTGVVGKVTVDAGAGLQGGDGVAASGALSSAGDVTLNDGAIIKLTLGTAGTHSSLARLGGTWTFDLDQAFSFNGGAEAGTYDNLITGLTGAEAGLPGIATWAVLNPEYFGSTFTYDGAGGVDLVLVPEPGAAVTLIGGVGLLLGWHRRRPRSARTSSARG